MSVKKLALFFSNGIGLCNWERKGLLSRETALYRKLIEKGWEVDFYTYDRSKKLPDLHLPITIIPQWPFITPKRFNFFYEFIFSLLRFRQGVTASILMTNQAYRGWPAIIAGRVWGKKVVARCGMVFGEKVEKTGEMGWCVLWRKWLEKFTFRHADLCFVPTISLASWLETNYGVSSTKIEVIPNYVDTDLFQPCYSNESSRDIVVVGRMEKVKRHRLLLEADKGWRLRFIGRGSLADELIGYAQSHSIDLEWFESIPNVELATHLTDVKVFALLSEWEGHPKALLEAMACGCACIGADAPGIREIITHEVNGLLVQPNVVALTEAIEKLLDDDILRQRLGREARAYVVENYSLENISDKVHRILADLSVTTDC